MEGPDHTYDMPSGVLAVLERISAEAEASPRLAGHVPEAGFLGALEELHDALEEEPVDYELIHPRTGEPEVVRIDGNALRRVALGVTGRVNSRSGVGTWPADVLRMYEGDFEPVARALLGRSGERTGLQTASFFMLDCGSGISPARREKLLADPAARIVGRLEYLYETACPAWEADLGEEFRRGFETEIPTVVVHGTWDVSTPFENALECLPFFENLNFVVVEGGTHGALREAMGFSPDFAAALMAFATRGETGGLPGEVRLPPIAWSVPP